MTHYEPLQARDVTGVLPSERWTIGYRKATRATHGETHMRWHTVAMVYKPEYARLLAAAPNLRELASVAWHLLDGDEDYGGYSKELLAKKLRRALDDIERKST